jgi:hypothetical protein
MLVRVGLSMEQVRMTTRPLGRRIICGVLAATLGLLAAACSSGPPPVPADARQVHVGLGAIQMRARYDGSLWVVDETDHRTVWSGPVHRGDAIMLSTPDDSQGTLIVAGEVKVQKGLSPGHRYVVYETAQRSEEG